MGIGDRPEIPASTLADLFKAPANHVLIFAPTGMDPAKRERAHMDVKSDSAATLTIKAAFTVPEFCQRYAIGRSSVYEQRRRGRLVFRKIGGRSIILASEAERWANSLPEAGK